jgi:hypothetical protein
LIGKEEQMTNAGVTVDPEVTIRAYLEAFEARDLARCLEFYNDDAAVHFQFSPYEGIQAIEAWHRERFEADLRILRIEEIVTEGDGLQVNALVASKRLRAWRFENLSVTIDVEFGGGRIQTLRCDLRATPW